MSEPGDLVVDQRRNVEEREPDEIEPCFPGAVPRQQVPREHVHEEVVIGAEDAPHLGIADDVHAEVPDGVQRPELVVAEVWGEASHPPAGDLRLAAQLERLARERGGALGVRVVHEGV